MMIKTLDGNKKNFLISLSKNLAKRKSLQLSKTSSVQKIIKCVCERLMIWQKNLPTVKQP